MPDFKVEQVFTYHAPKGDQPQRYESLRQAARDFAQLIEAYCPTSREKSLAFTSLQQTVMWANAAIAINEAET